MKYIRVDWPEIQDYMNNPGWPDEVGFDPKNNCWFIPEDWEDEFKELKEVKENVFKSLMEGFKKLENTCKELENTCNDCLNLRKYDKG